MYSEKQIDFLLNSTHSFNICSGVSSSGKTYVNNLRWYEYIQNEVPKDSLLIMSARTKESLYDNVIRDLEKIGEDDSSGIIKVQQQPLRVKILNKNIEIACVGANDESSWGRVQGKTVFGWYADEIIEHPESLVNILIKSCRGDGHTWPKFWTCNPSYPSHYIKKKFIDSKELDVRNWYWGFEDNPALSKESVAELKNSLTGAFLQRLFYGRWVAAEGNIYDKFARDKHIINEYPIDEIVEYVIGIDWGYENPLALVLMGIDSDNTYYVIDELYLTKQLINKELVDIIRDKGWYNIKNGYGMEMNPSYAYADTNRPEYILSFTQLANITTLPALKDEKSVNQGIQKVQEKFMDKGNGKYGIYIMDKCKHWISEHESYTWKKNTTGKDEPVKTNDHLCDATRYVIYTREQGRVRRIKNNPF